MTEKQKSFSILRSWNYCHIDIAEEFLQLQKTNALSRNCQYQRIWQTKQKYVLKVTADNGVTFAYKAYDDLKKKYKYLFRLSPCGAEAANIQLITALGIPMPRLLAAGDKRQCGILQSSYIATEFAEGFRDGRDFYGSGTAAENHPLRNEFIKKNMELLAHCHDNNIVHRGFTPANLLYKHNGTGNQIDLMWIDVASCRKLPRWVLKKMFIVDFEQFFRFFDFSDAELAEFIQHYLQNSAAPPATAGDIIKKLRIALAKRNKR